MKRRWTVNGMTARHAGAILMLSGALFVSPSLLKATPFTPLEYQPRLFSWSGDRNVNFLDDRLEALKPGTVTDVIVLINRCYTQNEVAEILSRYGRIDYVGRFMTFAVIRGVKVEDLPAIAAEPITAMVELDAAGVYLLDTSARAIRKRISPAFSPNTVDDAFPGIQGNGVGIAVLDSGVDNGGGPGTTHTFLPASKVVGTYDAVADSEAVDPDDIYGHGTHVAGIALGTGGTGAVYQGVAPQANLVDMLIGNTAPVTSAALRAVEKCIQRKDTWGIHVIQTSFSVGSNSDGKDSLSQIMNLAVQEGLVAVAAAGNDSSNSFSPPASADDIITVGNFNDNNTVGQADDAMAGSSNTGPRLDDLDGDGHDELKPDVAAPGSFIVSAQHNSASGTVSKSGTSMAAPHVSGVAALLVQSLPGINPLTVKDIIKRTATDRDGVSFPLLDPVYDTAWGQGQVNAFAALNLARDTDVRFPNAPPACCGCPDVFTATPPQVGVPNTVTAVLENVGPGPVVNATISFGVYIFGNGSNFYSIGQRLVSMPAGAGSVNVSVPWTPQASPTGNPHACLKVQIGYGLDNSFNNNSCQRNINIQQTSEAIYTAMVENNLTVPAVMHLVPRGELKRGWNLDIQPNVFELRPFECGQVVRVKLASPPGAPPEEMQRVAIDVIADTGQRQIPHNGFEVIGCVHGGKPPTLVSERISPTEQWIYVNDGEGGITHVNIVDSFGVETFVPSFEPGQPTVRVRARTLKQGRLVIEAWDCAFNRTRDTFLFNVPKGDVNGDTQVNTGDAIPVLRYVVGIIPLSGDQLGVADVNCDGMVNTGDAVVMLRYAVGLIPGFPPCP